MSISNDEWTLKVFHPDGCCNIVGGLTLASWEKGVVWDVGPGVDSVTATHNNYLVVTVLIILCTRGERRNNSQWTLSYAREGRGNWCTITVGGLSILCMYSPADIPSTFHQSASGAGSVESFACLCI